MARVSSDLAVGVSDAAAGEGAIATNGSGRSASGLGFGTCGRRSTVADLIGAGAWIFATAAVAV